MRGWGSPGHLIINLHIFFGNNFVVTAIVHFAMRFDSISSLKKNVPHSNVIDIDSGILCEWIGTLSADPAEWASRRTDEGAGPPSGPTASAPEPASAHPGL